MILGIDPGPVQSAFCLWDSVSIREHGIRPNDVLSIQLHHLSVGITVACEHLQCFGMAVGSEIFETAYWIGDFRATCRQRGIIFARAYRGAVKMHHCNSMRAKDANIRQALIDRFGPPGTKKAPGLTYGVKADIWSAFAIATMIADKSLTANGR